MNIDSISSPLYNTPQNNKNFDTKVEVESSSIDKKAEFEHQNYYQKEKLSKEELEKTIESLNSFIAPTQTALKFTLHEKLKDYYVQIINDESKEVIREIPSKKILDMHAAMLEYIGVIIDKKI